MRYSASDRAGCARVSAGFYWRQACRGWRYGKRAVALLAALLLAPAVQANGGVWENDIRATGSLLVPSGHFALQREVLDIRLGAENYEVKVAYHLRARPGQAAKGPLAMYFPVTCSPSEELRPDRKPCIHRFRAELDGKPLPVDIVGTSEVRAEAALAGEAGRLDQRVRELRAGDETQESESLPVYHRLALPASSREALLTVHYRADYNQECGGTSKSPGNYCALARLIYDFLPAAAWAGSQTQALRIRLDASGLQGSLDYDKARWPFVWHGTRGELTLRRPDFSQLPPLLLEVDNHAYLSYRGFVSDLKAGGARYTVRLVSGQASSGHDDIAALTDLNPATYWCWRGPRAVLALRFQPQLLVRESYPEAGAQPLYFNMRLVALGVLNGSPTTPGDYLRHGLAARFRVPGKTVKAGVEGEGAQDGQERVAALESRPVMQGTRDRYASFGWFELFNEGFLDSRFPELGGTVPKEKVKYWRQRIGQKDYRLEITAGLPGRRKNESCIAELFPVYLN